MSHGVTPYRVLVIDDNPSIHDDFRKTLAPPAPSSAAVDELELALFGQTACEVTPTYEIDTAAQGEEGLEKVVRSVRENRPYAMVFTDMRMPPGWDGVQTLREIWKVAPGQQAAVCTAYSDYSPEQIAAELGVRGKMVIVRKPFDPTEVRQLADMVCEKWELSRRRGDLEKEVETRTAELKRAALHDALTGLPNRILFNDRLGQSLLRAKRDASYGFAVLFVDCDNFKTVNDTLGHPAGDALLKQIAGRLQNVIGHGGAGSIAARIGGDEFALLVCGTADRDAAAAIARRTLDAGIAPYTLTGQSVRSGMSIGATTSGISYETPEDVVRDADRAMYQAKHGGRNRYVLFDQASHDEAGKRHQLETDLRSAVENGLIRPHFQPIIATDSRTLVGFEALARWHHPTLGLLRPKDFIPLAEETGLIVRLGMSVLEESCKQLVAWQAQFPNLNALSMSVNLSRKQLAWPGLVDAVHDVICRTGVRASQVKLEVTESSVMDDAKKAADVLGRLRAIDVQLQMDDFGSGYSALSCLQSFPISGLKLDGAFLSDLTTNPAAGPLLAAVAALAQGLNLPVVAEGVESDSQLAQLKSLGCEFAQGFLIAPPMDPTSATAFVAGVATHAAKAA